MVESSNFDPRRTFAGSGAGLRLVHRFRRIDQDTLDYSYTVEDPESFVEPWSVEFPLTNAPAMIYEFACHEGNRSMPLLLLGARATEESARFVGAFELVSYERVNPAVVAPAYSEGMMLYDASGHVSVHLLTVAGSRPADTDAERATSVESHVAYYGDYDVNVFQGEVHHYIEQASGPDF